MIYLKQIRQTPKSKDQNFTQSELFIKTSNTEKYLDFSYVLEDRVRDLNKNGKFDDGEVKVYGETAIPFGKYKGQVTWSPKFKRMMPAIFGVDKSEGIRMHGGNTIEHTFGCPIVAYETDNNGKVWNSAESDLTALIMQNDKDYKFEIEII